MKNNSFTNKIQQPFMKAIKKNRPVRQSQPNFLSNQIINDVERIKDYHIYKEFKTKKQPRYTQLQITNNNSFLSPDFKLDHPKMSKNQTFLSPQSHLEARMMKKLPSTTYIHPEIPSSHNFKKKHNPAIQLKNRKSPLKNNKQSLNLIQQMLMNYGIDVNKKIVNKQKQPRYSQPVLTQKDEFQYCKKKQNDRLINKNRFQELDQSYNDNLKETMSTSASFKKIKEVKISDFYLGKDLGKGKFGKVKIVKHKKTGLIFCVKIIKKAQIKENNIIDQLIKQIKIQSFINHSHIVKLYTVFDDKQYIYLLQQLCTQGNLYSLMQKKIKFSQEQTSLILKYLCQAIFQLHQMNIVHRDIKPQNIVMCYGMAKVCDFGWSTQIKQSMRQTFCGTPLYVSPQLLSGNSYGQKVDLWAIGILGFQMLTGSIPFRIKSERDLIKIVQNQIFFPKWMSQQAVSFLKSLLEKNPKKRKQISQMILDPFINKSHNNKNE